MKGAAVLFIERVLFIPNSKISSEKQLVGQSQDRSPFTVHAQRKLTHTLAHLYAKAPPSQLFFFFYTRIQCSKNMWTRLQCIRRCVRWRGHGTLTECSSWSTAAFNVLGDQYSQPAPIDCNSSSFLSFFFFFCFSISFSPTHTPH